MKKCKCGCGKKIEIKPFHKNIGIPDYIKNHNWRGKKHTEETKKKMREISKKQYENGRINKCLFGKKEKNLNWKGGISNKYKLITLCNSCHIKSHRKGDKNG